MRESMSESSAVNEKLLKEGIQKQIAMVTSLAAAMDVPEWMKVRKQKPLYSQRSVKCANISCHKPATGKKAYCSSECCKLDREHTKKRGG